MQKHSHDDPAQTHQWDLAEENPLNSLGDISPILRGFGSGLKSLIPKIYPQELRGFPETLPPLQDKSCNIPIAKLPEQISADSLNWEGAVVLVAAAILQAV